MMILRHYHHHQSPTLIHFHTPTTLHFLPSLPFPLPIANNHQSPTTYSNSPEWLTGNRSLNRKRIYCRWPRRGIRGEFEPNKSCEEGGGLRGSTHPSKGFCASEAATVCGWGSREGGGRSATSQIRNCANPPRHPIRSGPGVSTQAAPPQDSSPYTLHSTPLHYTNE